MLIFSAAYFGAFAFFVYFCIFGAYFGIFSLILFCLDLLLVLLIFSDFAVGSCLPVRGTGPRGTR